MRSLIHDLKLVFWSGLLGLIFGGVPAWAQTLAERPLSDIIIVPQAREFRPPPHHHRPVEGRVEITGVAVRIAIADQTAETTMDIDLANRGGARREAEMIVPVPEGAVVRSFSFQGAAKEPTAQVLPREEARRIYDSIVARTRDPALLEFIGTNLIRSSVFPVEAGGTQKVRLTYEMILPADGNRIDYVLPRTESLDYRVPWKIQAIIGSKTPISTVYSPTHEIVTESEGEKRVKVRLAESATTKTGPFRLSWLRTQNGLNASLIAYPDPKIGGGYFLLLTGLPARPAEKARHSAIKREVQIVFDRSGSMTGEKIEQVRAAALQILGALEPGETFNIIMYNEGVDTFAEAPVPNTPDNMRRAREYIESITALGGTNIHDALLEALRQKPTLGALPIVLFLTDGLPTIGQTSEAAIREMARKANEYKRRIFSFGVGVEVNAPLLDKIADESRAVSTYVLPKEDVEVKVAGVFKRLSGPILAEPELKLVGVNGEADPGRVRDLLPARLPDLFDGDQLVLLGQYVGERPLGFRLTGNYLGNERTFNFDFALDKASTRNAYVPRLWASRKIAVLIDAIRQMGADGDPFSPRLPDRNDPRVRELVDEIVRLSTEFGILTEYTAFLAREGTELAGAEFRGRAALSAGDNLADRAMGMRAGAPAVSQSLNNAPMKVQKQLNYSNTFINEKMEAVQTTNVQQINDMAFYQRGDRWIDSRLVGKAEAAPARVVEVGTQEFSDLATRLGEQNRQGGLSLQGEILIDVEGEAVLVKGAE